jgi:hypothetical protein
MTTPLAKDFRSHYPQVAIELDEWNGLAIGFDEAAARYRGLSHREAEKVLDQRGGNGLPDLLSALGQGDVQTGSITWQFQDLQMQASWSQDTFREPAWSTIIGKPATGLSETDIQRIWDAVCAFQDLPDVRDWRMRLQETRRLRPILVEGLGRAEIAVELEGRCEHCPA